MIKTITIFGRQRTKKDGKTKFLTWSYSKQLKNGERKFFEVKFTQACGNRPAKEGFWKLTLESTNASIEKRNGKLNDILWIKEVEEFEEDKETLQELRERQAKELEEVL